MQQKREPTLEELCKKLSPKAARKILLKYAPIGLLSAVGAGVAWHFFHAEVIDEYIFMDYMPLPLKYGMDCIVGGLAGNKVMEALLMKGAKKYSKQPPEAK